MGYANATEVLHGWAHLPPNARFVLLAMALTIPDETRRPRWFGGDERLLSALGRADPPKHDRSEEAERIRHTNGVTLRKAVSDAVRAGALEYAVRPSRNRSGEYWCRWSPGPELQGSLAAGARNPCSSRKEVLQLAQGILAPEEERGGQTIRGREEVTGVSISPAQDDQACGQPHRAPAAVPPAATRPYLAAASAIDTPRPRARTNPPGAP